MSNKKLGALWEGTTKNGQLYFNGSIEINGEKIKVVVFKNNKRPDKKDPDYVIYESQPINSSFTHKAEPLKAVSVADDEIPF